MRESNFGRFDVTARLIQFQLSHSGRGTHGMNDDMRCGYDDEVRGRRWNEGESMLFRKNLEQEMNSAFVRIR